MATKLCLRVLLCFSYGVFGFNLEPRIPVVKFGSPGSYFGFSVAEHQTTAGDVASSWCVSPLQCFKKRVMSRAKVDHLASFVNLLESIQRTALCGVGSSSYHVTFTNERSNSDALKTVPAEARSIGQTAASAQGFVVFGAGRIESPSEAYAYLPFTKQRGEAEGGGLHVVFVPRG
ncbi:hypothetical protein EVAR_81871_1 [Eumeta japonica]|uniref:Uncharacterized protein n=1 Tax=Eumeta variegata TaxID=151549 RepID=A0A4C1UWU3_EUMVA|nr:hypothetical protein EVAR_81871_1 [Eumeta japonica]